MATEIKKEIELEIAHVLFIDTVGYSKLSLNQQRAAIAELNEIVRGSAQFQKSEAESEVLKLAMGMVWRWYFRPARRRRSFAHLGNPL